MILLAADLHNAENRVQLMYTGDPAMRTLATARPWELDLHTANAAFLFNKRDADVTKDERQLGKTINHAAMRGMGADTCVATLLKEGTVRSPIECQRFLDAYLARYAPLRTYFSDVRRLVLRHRALANTWGRIVDYRYRRLDDQLFRDAYSFWPQSEVADTLNQWGLLPLWHKLRAGGSTARINAQVHDAILLSCAEEDAYDIAVWLRATLERPRLYLGHAMTIPVTFALGRSWGTLHEWKRLPARSAFHLEPAPAGAPAAAA